MFPSNPSPHRFQSTPGRVPMPPIESPPEAENDNNTALLPVVAILGLILLLLMLLLLFLVLRPPAGGGNNGMPGTGAGTKTGEGSGDFDGDSHGTAGTETGTKAGEESDDSVGDDKNDESDTSKSATDEELGKPASEDGMAEEGELTPDTAEMGTSVEAKTPEVKSGQPEAERLEPESVPKEQPLGERIADNLNTASEPDDGDRDGKNGSEGGGKGFGVVKVKLFGIDGFGSSFVYVFDRSTSMTGQKLREAQRELTESLSMLNEKHRFNIIFYDDSFVVWKPGRNLVVADPSEKKDAVEFVQNIQAQGTTEHLRPILEALAYKPDVIFFLTDGQALTEPGLDEITRRSGKTSINVIQFADPNEDESDILRRLAKRNRGQYKYINASTSDAL